MITHTEVAYIYYFRSSSNVFMLGLTILFEA